MEFKVVLSRQAQIDFRNIAHYLLYDLRNEQAAISVIDDMEYTIVQLSYIARYAPDFEQHSRRKIRRSIHKLFFNCS